MHIDHYPLRGATGVVTDVDVVCGICEKPRRVFVNRAGTTRCIACDQHALATDPIVADVAMHLLVAEHFDPVQENA